MLSSKATALHEVLSQVILVGSSVESSVSTRGYGFNAASDCVLALKLQKVLCVQRDL